MKKRILTLLISCFSVSLAFSQNTNWQLSGNTNVDSSCFIGTTSPTDLHIRTNNQEAMTITSDGKVGIGEASPAKELTVSGELQVKTLAGTGYRALFANPDGTVEAVPLAPQVGGSDPNFCQKVLWSGAGNDIQQDCYLGTNNQQDLVIKTAGFEKMRITTDGKVGIIQPNPVAQLHIGQNFPLTYSQRSDHNALGFNNYWNGINGPLTQIGPGPSAAINFIDNRGLLHLAVYPDVGGGSTFAASGGGVYISETGFVGINEDTPEAQFEVGGRSILGGPTIVRDSALVEGLLYVDNDAKVNGLICAKEVRVRLSGGSCWPDYVFADDYELQSLSEVERFVDENGHLPGVPSSGDIEANGVEVGEMNTILLRKIEELTLHIIELEKEIKKLKAEE